MERGPVAVTDLSIATRLLKDSWTKELLCPDSYYYVFALLLAVIGIYGVVSYAVVRRRREMGVRLALGATPVKLRRRLLRQGLFAVAAGSICGIVGAMLTGRFLASFVEGTKYADPATLILSILFIALIASASIWAATRRIAQLDILDILRTE